MNKIITLAMLILALFIVGCTTTIEENNITSFEECVKAGNPIMESYPAKCSDGKNTFTEEIEEQIQEPQEIKDSYNNIVPNSCSAWYDGCNTCKVTENGMLACTRMFCPEEILKPATCLENNK
jgi:hypothetical protein